MAALDYLPGLVAFLVVVFGIVGKPKWDDTKRGIQRLTLAGRITLALGIIALLGSLILTWRTQRNNDVQSQQRARIRSIAHAELRLALRQVTGHWFRLFGGDDSTDSEFEIVPPHVEDAERLATVVRLDPNSFKSPFSGTDSAKWNYVLKHNADLGATKIDRVLQIYAAYLDPPILENVSNIRTSELLWRLQHFDEGGPFPFPDPTGDIHPKGMFDEEYSKFWKSMRTLDSLLEKDAARLRRRI